MKNEEEERKATNLREMQRGKKNKGRKIGR